jgi:lysozyme family protein
LRYADRVGLDLDRDGDTDSTDIRLVTPEVARRLFYRDFYLAPRLNRLPLTLQPLLFDMAVNFGPPRAVMILQQVLVDAECMPPYDARGRAMVDGVLGPATAKACTTIDAVILNNMVVDARSLYHSAVAMTVRGQNQFLRGWLARSEKFRVN